MAEPYPGQIRLECDRPVVSGKGVVIALQLDECMATTEPCLGQIGLERQRLAEKRVSLNWPAAIHRLHCILQCVFSSAHNASLLFIHRRLDLTRSGFTQSECSERLSSHSGSERRSSSKVGIDWPRRRPKPSR